MLGRLLSITGPAPKTLILIEFDFRPVVVLSTTAFGPTGAFGRTKITVLSDHVEMLDTGIPPTVMLPLSVPKLVPVA